MEPTVEQLKTCHRFLVSFTKMLLPVNLVRVDERTENLILLIGETIVVEIYQNGEFEIDD